MQDRQATLFKKKAPPMFSCEFHENFKNTFFIEHFLSLLYVN